jgi:MFS family permease
MGYTPLRRDLTLARASLVFAFVGTVIIAVAPFGALCIIALVIFSFGSGFPALFRALICAVVEPHTLGTLNTAIAMTESLMGLVSSPALGWLLSKGIDLGGGWMGLPFMVSAALVAVVTALLFIFRLPAAFKSS